MSELESPWDLYFQLQAELRDGTVVDDAAWAREAQLDRLLASTAPPNTGELDRVALSRSRRERYRASLRRKHLKTHSDAGGEGLVLALQELHIIRAVLGDDALMLLVNVGEGASYDELAVATGVSPGALRVRVRRARRRILALVA